MINVSSFSPVNMVSKSVKQSKRFKLLADDLYSRKIITAAVADNATFQYDDMLKEALKHKEEFLSNKSCRCISWFLYLDQC